MDQQVTTLLEQLIPTPDQMDTLTQEQRDDIDLVNWVANTLWQLKYAGENQSPVQMRLGLINEDVVQKALPLFEKKGWKAKLHRDMMPGDGNRVEFTRA